MPGWMPIWAIIVIATVLVLAGLLVFLLAKLRQVRGVREAEVAERLKGDTILFQDRSANFFGQESRGRTQVRGNGILTVTDKGVHFLMWVPRRETAIPTASITGIEHVRSHLGKAIARKLLKVGYTNDEGRPDSGAWYTRDLDAATRAVEEIAAGRD